MRATPAPVGTTRLLLVLLWPVSIYNMESSLEDTSSVWGGDAGGADEEDSDNMKIFKQQNGCVSHRNSSETHASWEYLRRSISINIRCKQQMAVKKQKVNLGMQIRISTKNNFKVSVSMKGLENSEVTYTVY